MILQDSRALVSRFKLLPQYAVSYSENLERNYINYNPPVKHFSKGLISKKAQSRLRSQIQWMALFAERKFVWSKKKSKGFYFRLNFCTVTLSSKQVHTDFYILHRLFFPLLKYLQRTYHVYNYVWKAEIQPARYLKRGERCIHFHFTTDKFIHYRKLRNKWNQLQATHGYIHADFDANSTDVHSVINEKEIGWYIAKYLVKIPSGEEHPEATEEQLNALKVNCKVYGSSRKLQNLDCTLMEELTPDYYNEFNHHTNEHCTLHQQENYYSVYLHKLSMEKKYGLQVATALGNLYKVFHERSDGVTKFVLD